jgi:hypothetical protein
MSDSKPHRPEDFDAALRARIEAQLADVEPDFEDMMRRAEQRTEQDFDALELDAEPELPTVEEDASNQRVLRPYVHAYKGRLDEALVEVQPRMPESEKARGRAAWWLGLVAAAALILGWIGARSGLGFQGGVQVQPGSTAVDEARGASTTESATTTRARGRRSATTREVPTEPEAIEALDPIDPVPEPEPEPEPERPAKAKKSAPKSIDERIAALDAAAQAAWRKGDKRTAMRKFQKIVDIGGRRPAVELAFGELFSLNRQLGKSPTKLWRAYLRRFPRGRYAEDAKAGLCRRSTGDAARSCWSEYAKAFPGGAHLEEAAKASEAKGG